MPLLRFALVHRLLRRLPASVPRTAVFALAAVIALSGSGACLYSDPINMPPTVSIKDPGPVSRKQLVTFSAVQSDDAISLQWKQVGCSIPSGGTAADCKACQESENVKADKSSWPKGDDWTLAQTFQVVDTDLPSCIWAKVTDHYNAQAAAVFALNPVNHQPISQISVAKGDLATGTDQFRLYHEIELSTEGSTDADGDSLSNAQWHLIGAPKNSTIPASPNPGLCSTSTSTSSQPSTSWCFTPDKFGPYRVQLTIDDGYGDATASGAPPATVTKDIMVADDQFPCLIEYEPRTSLTEYTANKTLRVKRVDDDGDPGKVHYRWFKGMSVGALDATDNDVPDFVLPELDPGDVLIVRVEIFDEANEAKIEESEQHCMNDDTCSQALGQTVCNQRWTWRVHYSQ